MKNTIAYFAAVVLAVGLYGCGGPAESESTAEPSLSATADGSGDKHADHDADHVDGDLSDMEKMKVELAKLSPEDAASAEKQHFCPVAGYMLGVDGPPIKVDVKGQQVWICCEACRKTLLENPDEYLAKLKKK